LLLAKSEDAMEEDAGADAGADAGGSEKTTDLLRLRL
jgi:hypothetical protein